MYVEGGWGGGSFNCLHKYCCVHIGGVHLK